MDRLHIETSIFIRDIKLLLWFVNLRYDIIDYSAAEDIKTLDSILENSDTLPHPPVIREINLVSEKSIFIHTILLYGAKYSTVNSLLYKAHLLV